MTVDEAHDMVKDLFSRSGGPSGLGRILATKVQSQGGRLLRALDEIHSLRFEPPGPHPEPRPVREVPGARRALAREVDTALERETWRVVEFEDNAEGEREPEHVAPFRSCQDQLCTVCPRRPTSFGAGWWG
jgi:hypothetical protein